MHGTTRNRFRVEQITVETAVILKDDLGARESNPSVGSVGRGVCKHVVNLNDTVNGKSPQGFWRIIPQVG